MPSSLLFFTFIFLFGAIIGSFLNVCIFRIPEGRSVVWPASHCPHCQKPIPIYDNIPVLSFLFLKGKCRSCFHKISWQYPLVEILSGILAIACIFRFAWNPFFHSIEINSVWIAGVWFVAFLCPLLVISVIDFHWFIIPDVLSLPLIPLGVFVHWLTGERLGTASAFINSGLGILLGAGLLWLVARLYLLIRRTEGLGMGDVKLAAMIGAFLGWKGIIFVILFSSLLGSFVGIALMLLSRFGIRSELPYGPFLSAAAVFYLFFENLILKI